MHLLESIVAAALGPRRLGKSVLCLGGFLPLLAPAAELRNAQAPVSKANHQTVVIIGDSLAAGYGLDPSEAFPALIQKKIDELGWPFVVVNAGVSGDTSSGGLRRIEWLLKHRIDVLLLELGGNDGLRGLTPDVTKTNLQAIIDRTRKRYPKAQIVIAGMQMPPNMGADYTNRFQKIFPDLARENEAALVPFLLEGVGGNAALNLPDRIHPTAAGHQIVAENVWKVLQPILGKMRPRAQSGEATGHAILESATER
jgi:acyl-CoA thioesterase-1